MNNNYRPSLSKKALLNSRNRSPVKEIMTYADENYLSSIGLQNKEIISFAGGWVNHEAPIEMKEAYESILSSQNLFHDSGSYAPTIGSHEAKEAVRKFEKYLYGAEISVDEIAIGLGSTHLAVNLFETILDPGDKVVMLDPCYCNYPVQLMSAVNGVEIVRFPVIDVANWKYIAEQKTGEFVEFILKIKPKAVLLISPDNPTSQVLTDDFCRATLHAVEKINGYLIMDYAYREIIFGETVPSYFGWGVTPHFISICSNSKWCRGLGRRLGWLKASSEVISALESMLSTTILCADNFHQMAFAKYVDLAITRATLKNYIRNTCDQYMIASQHMVDSLRNILDVECFDPQGGLFTCFNTNENSASFVQRILMGTGVLLVPGWGFGETMKSAVRLSYGPLVQDLDLIDRGVEAISCEFSH